MSSRTIGWLWVAGQVFLLGTLLLLPGGDAWPTPGFVSILASALVVLGLALVAAAALRLGSALTPTPVPTERGELTTFGLYRYVRHPIYSGVIVAIVGMALGSGSWIQLAISALTIVFFDRKAAWEEQQLRKRYPGYADYAKRTPRFIPWPFGRS